ncbi:EF-hand calcium-binding domain-containing protein 6 isoform X1 [Triplophysa dalaica]|uniref:EF-hand calcium-binding domain-containing protein 6 isoform X1 n=1 Tax=Triplophysa dalaica TaxID=1582913 RepID=UPI0024DF3977|nr:EF-hand calcium-binding domain-containing protein 6 isoform X1 [Triplophysa dalaica]XP_056593755.1 EF-hand calcium-binding domain-containing protein 6 isoform X1 [Triplophysa dalaica]
MSTAASLRLPAIQHPLSRLGDPELISLRGYSRDGSRDGCWIPKRRIRPQSPDTESLDSAFRSQSSMSSISSIMEKRRGVDIPQQIPEGDEAIYDSDKPKLSAYRHKMASENRSISRASGTTYSSNEAWVTDRTDQLEDVLKDRIQTTGALTLKILFKNNHPDGKPLVNRYALLEIVTKFLRRQVTAKQLKDLLLRLHLSDRTLISFEDFYGALKDPESKKNNPVGQLTIPQILALLRGPARSRFLQSVEVLCKSDNVTESWISAPEFRNILNKLKLPLKDPEFEKLWKRLDVDGFGAAKQTVLLKKLGLSRRIEPNNEKNHHVSITAKAEDMKASSGRTLSKAEEERRASIAMETWLKDKFREGAQRMKAEFEKLDAENSGKVRGEDFLQVLRKFDLHLRREHLGMFLSRCGLKLRKGSVHYLNFLCNFQDRSSDGITHKIISNPKHRFHSKENSSCVSSLSAIEAKLTNLFQSEYLSLLQTFQNIDKFNKGTVSQEEFRAAMESRFGLEISDPQFEQLLDRLPLDHRGNVQYPIFMAAFDTRKGVPSLFKPVAQLAGHDSDEERGSVEQNRSDLELFRVIRTVVANRYRDLLREFEELDEKNTRRLAQEEMYQLLKRLELHPEVTRGEVRRLWTSLFTQQDGTVDFQQFIRHFGPSPRSCCYPNAKHNPPKRGDNDLMRLSKTLNCVSDILVDALRAKVELCVSDLWTEFSEMDFAGTGFVSSEEFKEILMNLCVLLSQHECDVLAKKFDINNDGRVSYTEFLRPFLSQSQTWKHGTNMATALQSPRETKEIGTPGALSRKIRRKLRRKANALHRACGRLDGSDTGLLSVAELGAVLQLCGVCESQEELRSVFSTLHAHPSGLLDYRPLLIDKHRTSSCSQQTKHQLSQRSQ